MKSARKLRTVSAPVSTTTPASNAGGPEIATVDAVTSEGPSVSFGGRSARASITALGYRPSTGDRVLVAEDGEAVVIVAVVRAALAPAFVLGDGSTAELREGALEVKRPDGSLLVRCKDGAVEIAPPAGDLRLAAPAGRVLIEAGQDVTIHAARDLAHTAGRAARVEAPTAAIKSKKLEVESRSSRLVTGEATVLARHVATTAETIATKCLKYELEATKLVERSREAFRDVADLAQTRVGRARTLVKGVYSVFSRRSVMVSKEDTSVDGGKILIG